MRKPMLAALAIVAFTVPAQAQLPDARSLIAKHNEVTGNTALLQVKSLRETGTFEMPMMGMSGNIEVLRANPNKIVVHVMLPGVGDVVRGFDGTVGYTVNPMQGSVVLSGKPLEAAAEDAQFAATLRAPELFTSAETIEKSNLGGQECYKVKLVWKSGRTTFDCYATDTGLLAGAIVTQETPQGPMEITSTMSDYKQFGPMKIATKVTQTVMDQQQVTTITAVEFDKVDAAMFALPASIQALVPKKD